MSRISPVSAWKCRLVLLTSLLALSWSGARAADPEWLRVETPDFVAYSDAAASDVVEFAVEFSAYHEAFRSLFSAPGHTLPPTTVLLFRRKQDFDAATPKVEHRKKTLMNYSVDVDGAALLALAVSENEAEVISRTFEFETVWALRRMGYYLPVWLAQGAGEVLATVDVTKGKCLVGRESAQHAERFAADRELIPWPRFFEIGESSPEYAGKLATGAFHSQAWALMHWVLLKDDHSRERFQLLAGKLRTMPGIEAVPAVMGVPPENFRAAIEQHLRDFRTPRAVPFDAGKVRAALKVTPAPMAEVLAQTSNLLAAAGRIDECNAQLEKARQLAPDRADVKEAWARRALRENHPDEATRLYREAIAAGSTSFAAYLNSATARLDATMVEDGDRPGSGGPDALVALEEVRRAIALNPGSSEAYRLLGRTFWVMPTLSDADVNELRRGVVAGKAGARVRYYRGLLYSRLGKTAQSLTDFQQVVDDPDATDTDRNRARERLAYERYIVDLKQVNELVDQKHYDEARRIISAASARGLEPESSQRYDALRGWLEEDAAWTNLTALGEASRWADLRVAAHKFAVDFPQSRQAAAAQRLEKEAQRMEPSSTK